MTQNQLVRFRDFTDTAEPVSFRVDQDTFHVVQALSMEDLADFAELADGATQLKPREQLDMMRKFYAVALEPTSYEQFLARITRGSTHPIPFPTVISIMQWLMEILTQVPTQPSDDLSDTSSDDGTSSTAGASPTALTS